MLYLVRATDFTDEQALQRRLAARAEHIAYSDAASNHIVLAVALQHPTQGHMNGSLLLTRFENEAQCRAWLANDPYQLQHVWETLHVQPAAVGPSFQHLFPAVYPSAV
jgi:uncharacterized protein